MTNEQTVKNLLAIQFTAKHVDAIVSHYLEAVKEYQRSNWEISLLKSGKFIEAVAKALHIHCGQTLPPARKFSAGTILRALAQLSGFDDVVRILIPRAGTFVYDIVSNRGARHDPDQIDPNKMDATVVISVISWMLAEMVRFAAQNSPTPGETSAIVENLIEKKYPYFEDIEGRLYINIRGLNPREVGLLLLNAQYPKRASRSELITAIRRHGHRGNNVDVALTRLRNIVDDDNGSWKLRATGRTEAENILAKKAPTL